MAMVALNSNVFFYIRLASHREFVSADVDTDFIQRNYADLFPESVNSTTPR
jgi:acetyl/propionyl-CoA carboxylase alpha subunit